MLRSAAYLPTAFWLVLVMTDGPIIPVSLIVHSKIQGFSRKLCKIQGFQGLELGPLKIKALKKSRPCTDHVHGIFLVTVTFQESLNHLKY